jgi:hypothetical protein
MPRHFGPQYAKSGYVAIRNHPNAPRVKVPQQQQQKAPAKKK